MTVKNYIVGALFAALPLFPFAQEFQPTKFALEYIASDVDGGDITPVESSLIIDLATDKACYAPGATVHFTANSMAQDARVRYRHGANVVHEEPFASKEWAWTAPSDDFRGYLVDIYVPRGNGGELILGTIAVDVSSDWTRFPRYGFVATFDNSKLNNGVIEREMEYLNRLHINGVQFQDWHNKHHWPLGGTRDRLLDTYRDIANRYIYTAAVKKYIDVQHSYGMKSIFYNLAFGALSDAAADGVSEKWYLWRDNRRGEKDFHGLPNGWKSNIYLVNPGNEEWQNYLADRNDDVYHNLDFDGYQIDQLGNRGNLYDYNGKKVDLPAGYESFIRAMKKRHPDKRLVMNAVGSYGANRIVGTGLTDFAYNEPWGDEASFDDLHSIIAANDSYSNGRIKTVFAAYMNYDKAGNGSGYMNTPGVLLTDAVMMALGGNHLEMGDHMLSREYFPSATLDMTDELRTALVRYYDFATAYENLLRDGSTSDEINLSARYEGTGSVSLNPWPPRRGGITTYSRCVGSRKVMHLLNFVNADDLSWRDLNGTRKAPTRLQSISMKAKPGMTVSKVWAASPDMHGGVPVELNFTQTGDDVSFTVPSLDYWTMIVFE